MPRRGALPVEQSKKRWLKMAAAGVALLALTWLYTYWARDRYQAVDEILPELYLAPQQHEAAAPDPMAFTLGDYAFTVTPLYDYQIWALVVSAKNYGSFTFSRSDRVIPVDLCLIWGTNVHNNRHQAPDVHFSQRRRFCFFRYRETSIDPAQVSNNHLIPANAEVRDVIKRIRPGDQIRLRGQLVSVDASLMARFTGLDPAEFSLRSSTNRDDTGAGACEIIFVREAEILRAANPVTRALFSLTSVLLLILISGGALWGGRQWWRRLQEDDG